MLFKPCHFKLKWGYHRGLSLDYIMRKHLLKSVTKLNINMNTSSWSVNSNLYKFKHFLVKWLLKIFKHSHPIFTISQLSPLEEGHSHAFIQTWMLLNKFPSLLKLLQWFWRGCRKCRELNAGQILIRKAHFEVLTYNTKTLSTANHIVERRITTIDFLDKVIN